MKYLSIVCLGIWVGSLWLADLFLKQNLLTFQTEMTKALALTVVLNTNGVEFAQAIINEPEVANGEYYDRENGKKFLATQLEINAGSLKDLTLPEVLIVYPSQLDYQNWTQLIAKLKQLKGVSAVLEPNYEVAGLFQQRTNYLKQRLIFKGLKWVVGFGLILVSKSLRRKENHLILEIILFCLGIIGVLHTHLGLIINEMIWPIMGFGLGSVIGKVNWPFYGTKN